MPKLLFWGLLALVLTGPGVAGATVTSHTLDNGMEVFVRPDHRAPVVTSMVWYRVGGIDEHLGKTGISHVLEHMMFKGTEEVGPGRFAEIIARHGGEYNAFTGQDYTAYYETMAAEHLEVALRLEADRMANLALDQEQFNKEVQVVMEERRLRVTNSPQAKARETLRSVVFDAHAYGLPVVGWMDDLSGLTLADLSAWYKRYYSPSNAHLVVAGDVKPERVFELAAKHFGDVPGGSSSAAIDPNPNVPVSGSRTVDLQDRVRVPQLSMAYRIPARGNLKADWEPLALRLAAGVLSGGRSARLPAKLVREQALAVSAGANYSPHKRGPGLFQLQGIPAGKNSLKQLRQALESEIRKLKEGTVTQQELRRIKQQIAASEVFQRDSVANYAMQIGKLETIGYGHEYLDTYLERVRSVTPKQIQRVAQKYLTTDRRTLVRLQPNASEQSAKAGETKHDG